MWLFNAYIPEYQGGVLSRFEPRAPRKLLLKKKQIDQLLGQVTKQGATLVPLQIHFNDQGRAKVLLGVGEGRQEAGQARGYRGSRLAAGQGSADAGAGIARAARVAGSGRELGRLMRARRAVFQRPTRVPAPRSEPGRRYL